MTDNHFVMIITSSDVSQVTHTHRNEIQIHTGDENDDDVISVSDCNNSDKITIVNWRPQSGAGENKFSDLGFF